MLNDIKKGSLNFNFSLFFLNKIIKKNILILYSWCRYCDDIIDNEILGFKKKNFNIKNKILNIHNFILNTQKIYCNLNVKEYHFNNLKKIIYKYNISPIYIFDNIKGYLIDFKKKKYNTFKDILNYCYYIAGIIGVIIIKIIIKNYNYNLLNNACNLGIAFQLTNISRDIILDYKNKRCYLPNYLFNKINLNKFNYFKKKKRKYLFIIVKKIINKSKLYYNLSLNILYLLPIKLFLTIFISYKIYNKIGKKIILNKEKSWNKRQKINFFEKILILINILIKLLYNKIKILNIYKY
ncbi:MAG: squalene/phytoene synthase family protein [Enterobacteriaceae bacterium PC38]|nr:MAG: squalene/phytoene synthase family protein [Enterobacteriaceae bacterium PC38]